MPEEIPTPDPAPTPEPTPTPAPDPAPAAKTFTQEQVDRIVGTRAADAKKEALQKLSEETGLTVDELKALAKADKERQEAEKTELDKLKEANETQKRELEGKFSQAQLEAHTERVKNQLLRAKVPLPEDEAKADEALDSLVKLVSAEPGASVEDIRASISSLKEQFPTLFTAPETKPSGNPPSNPSGNPRKPLLGASPADIGSSRAAQLNARRGVTPKTA